MEKILYDITAERILDHLNDIDYYSDEAITPYWEFSMDGDVYYLTSGGFLYRKDPGAEGVGGFFCGCLFQAADDPVGVSHRNVCCTVGSIPSRQQKVDVMPYTCVS